MSLEVVTADQFKNVFGDVPELKQPPVFPGRTKKTIIPFDSFQIDDRGNNHRIGILETSPYDNRDLDLNDDPDSYSDAQTVIRVTYDSLFGLKARTWQAFSRITRDAWSKEEKEEPELLLLSGNMKYDLGPISIMLSVDPLSILHTNDFMLRKQTSYYVAINVLSSGAPDTTPPLARVHYNLYGIRIPLQVEFVDAGYEEALQGLVELRSQRDDPSRLAYPKTYYEWRHLEGAVVGTERFEGEKGDKMYSSETIVQVNSPTSTLLEGTPYQASILHKRPDRFTKPILSLTRVNAETDESWILSVPEWIDNGNFIRDLSENQFVDFFSTYPVTFGVRRLEQKDQLFKT